MLQASMRLTVLLLGIVLLSWKTTAINYVFDEFLFSKNTWTSWKVENGLEGLNPADKLPDVKTNYPGFELAEYNSLDGPRPRLPSSQKSTAPAPSQDIDPVDDDSLLEHAAQAAQCVTCHVLVSVAWSRLTAEVLSGESVTPELVASHLEEACEREAVDSMLRRYTLLKMESEGGETSLVFFVVRERRDGAGGGLDPTPAEEGAVELSCKNLVSSAGKDLATELLSQLANYRREALRLLLKHEMDGGNSLDYPASKAAADDASGGADSKSSGAKASDSKGSGRSGKLPRMDSSGSITGVDDDDDDDDYVDPDDLDEGGSVRTSAQKKPESAGKTPEAAKEGGKGGSGKPAGREGAAQTGPVVRGLLVKEQGDDEDPCADLHHRCTEWAVGGECTRNPNYMVGTQHHKGQCRKACGVCQPRAGPPLPSALASELSQLSSALLLAVKNLGCGASGSCLTGVSGLAVGAGLLQQQGAGKKELPPGMTEFPGGFVLGKPWWGVPDVRPVPSDLASSSRKRSSPPPTPPSSSSPSSASSPPDAAEVDQLLRGALGDKLLSIPSDFFTYEYLYKNHTRHFHEDKNGEVTEDWLLGKFSRESLSLMSSATGEVAGLEDLDLLPGSVQADTLRGHTWPYVKQVYAGGDECVLGGGRRVVRRVEARLACSPDRQVYMLVREPDFCTYIFVLYVPQLCEMEYYKPRPRSAGGAGTGKGSGAGSGGGGAGGKSGRMRREGRGGGETKRMA